MLTVEITFLECTLLPLPRSNKVNKHFHCTRCGFSFVRYQTLESHAEKHQQEDEGVAVAGGATHHSLGPQSPIYLKKPRPDSPMDTPTPGGPAGRDSPSKGQGKPRQVSQLG